MKTFYAALLLAAAAASPAPAQCARHEPAHTPQQQQGQQAKHDKHEEHAQEGEKATAAEALEAGGGRIKRGQAIGKSPVVAFAHVLKNPSGFAGKTVVVEGVVERVCKAQGCWMQIAPEAGAADGVRVTFDHKFFVPKDADKLRFRAEGKFAVKTLSKEEVEHLVKDDGAKVKTNPDGTASEVSFVATGVELWK